MITRVLDSGILYGPSEEPNHNLNVPVRATVRRDTSARMPEQMGCKGCRKTFSDFRDKSLCAGSSASLLWGNVQMPAGSIARRGSSAANTQR